MVCGDWTGENQFSICKGLAADGYIFVWQDIRGRFRKSFETPEAIMRDQVNEYAIDLHWNDHAFLKGHKITVQVESTWFPLIDRNPRKLVPDIFMAKKSDHRPATERVAARRLRIAH